MIQRIQTLWLLLAAISLLVMFKFPVASSIDSGNQEKGFYINANFSLYILNGILILISVADIFLFKRRSKQKRLIGIGILSCILFLTLLYFPAQNFISTGISGQFEIGSVFPIGYIIFMILAFAGITKDEKLIRNANRLR